MASVFGNCCPTATQRVSLLMDVFIFMHGAQLVTSPTAPLVSCHFLFAAFVAWLDRFFYFHRGAVEGHLQRGRTGCVLQVWLEFHCFY